MAEGYVNQPIEISGNHWNSNYHGKCIKIGKLVIVAFAGIKSDTSWTLIQNAPPATNDNTVITTVNWNNGQFDIVANTFGGIQLQSTSTSTEELSFIGCYVSAT